MNRFLAGDIGGTKTRLAVIEVNGAQVMIQREAAYPSRDYAMFEQLLGDFLSGADIPRHAAFGIAGPVQGRVVQATNLPWRIDADALQRQFSLAHCTLLNDLEATAYSLPALGADDLLTLQSGIPNASGNAAVIAAGTGLGEAGMPVSARATNWKLPCCSTSGNGIGTLAGSVWFPAWGCRVCMNSCALIAKPLHHNG